MEKRCESGRPRAGRFAAPPTVTTQAFCGDGACYAVPLWKYLVAGRMAFTISADMTEDLAVVSNRWDLPPAELTRWHWPKARTIDAVHDATKNELAAGLPPSGKFGAKAFWYRILSAMPETRGVVRSI